MSYHSTGALGASALGSDTPAELDALFHITGSSYEKTFLRLVYPRCTGESCQGYSDTLGWWVSVVLAYASLTLSERNDAWKQLEILNKMALVPLRSRLKFNISIDAEAPKVGATAADRKAVADKAAMLVIGATAAKKADYAKLMADQAAAAAKKASQSGATAEDKLIAQQLAVYASEAKKEALVMSKITKPPVAKLAANVGLGPKAVVVADPLTRKEAEAVVVGPGPGNATQSVPTGLTTSGWVVVGVGAAAVVGVAVYVMSKRRRR